MDALTVAPSFAVCSFHGNSTVALDGCVAEDPASYEVPHPPEETSATCTDDVMGKIHEGKRLRLAMALLDGLQRSSDDRASEAAWLRSRVARAAGQEPAGDDPDALRRRLKSLARTTDRNLAEQLQLLVRFDEQKLYEQEGCRSMLLWMDVHLKLGRVAAFERLRVGRALLDLPLLASLFMLGEISFSQLRVLTRHATPANEGEFAVAVLELSVSQTIDYCHRFRHMAEEDEDRADAEMAGQEEADARAALRAYERRALSIREVDMHTTRVTLELPNDLAAEFLRSLEHVEDWIREGGEDETGAETVANVQVEQPEQPAQSARTATMLRADAAVLMSRRSLAHAGEAVAMADRYRVQVDVDVQHLGGQVAEFGSLDKGDTTRPTQRPQLRGRGPIPLAMARRLAATAGFTLFATDTDGEIIGTRQHAAPFSKRQLRALDSRDRCCQVPGCGATRHLHGHHVLHRANGGGSDLRNAALVCGSCHRLLHEGGFRLERIGPMGAVPGPLSAALDVDPSSRKRARARLAIVQRFRLYGPDGREHGSLGAAREVSRMRSVFCRRSTGESTRGDTSSPSGVAAIGERAAARPPPSRA